MTCKFQPTPYWVSKRLQFLEKNCWGPIPRNTSLDLDSVITRSIERILRAFDDAVQVGLVRLRLNEMSEIFQTTAISK